MITSSVTDIPQASWRQVAVDRFERMQQAVEGKPAKRELVEVIKPVLYIAKDGKVEIQEQGSSQTISLLA